MHFGISFFSYVQHAFIFDKIDMIPKSLQAIQRFGRYQYYVRGHSVVARVTNSLLFSVRNSILCNFHRNTGHRLVYEMQPMLHSYFHPRAAHIHMSIFIWT